MGGYTDDNLNGKCDYDASNQALSKHVQQPSALYAHCSDCTDTKRDNVTVTAMWGQPRAERQFANCFMETL